MAACSVLESYLQEEAPISIKAGRYGIFVSQHGLMYSGISDKFPIASGLIVLAEKHVGS